MDATVLIAGMGFVTTLLGVWITAHFQGKTDRDGRILEARLRVYGECSDSLFEYSRATYNRVKSRGQNVLEDRDAIRQEAYRCNARARSAIGQAHILTGDRDLEARLSMVRTEIGAYNGVATEEDLRRVQEGVYEQLNQALDVFRRHLVS